MVLVLEFGHEEGSDAGDGPADADVGAAVHLAHDSFEDAGADVGSAFVALLTLPWVISGRGALGSGRLGRGGRGR